MFIVCSGFLNSHHRSPSPRSISHWYKETGRALNVCLMCVCACVSTAVFSQELSPYLFQQHKHILHGACRWKIQHSLNAFTNHCILFYWHFAAVKADEIMRLWWVISERSEVGEWCPWLICPSYASMLIRWLCFFLLIIPNVCEQTSFDINFLTLSENISKWGGHAMDG